MNAGSHPQLLGSVACPECGWDDHGDLRIVDWYGEIYPPIPPPTNTLAIWGDDPERDGALGLTSCPQCDEEFDVERMRRR